MASVATNQEFDLYISHGVRGGTLLSPSQFDEFWNSLSTSQKQHWKALFVRGSTALTVEALESAGSATLTQTAIARAKSRGSR